MVLGDVDALFPEVGGESVVDSCDRHAGPEFLDRNGLSLRMKLGPINKISNKYLNNL
jgi:hypothetical protein